MGNGYELLVEKEVIWADMLMQVLSDNGIPCTSIPVFGAGLTIYTGKQDIMRIYVPKEKLEEAKELTEALFSADAVLEDDVL